jgi:hypothetical protein
MLPASCAGVGVEADPSPVREPQLPPGIVQLIRELPAVPVIGKVLLKIVTDPVKLLPD